MIVSNASASHFSDLLRSEPLSVSGGDRSRERCAQAPAQRDLVQGAEASLEGDGPRPVYRSVSAVSSGSRCRHDHSAGDASSLASIWIPSVLALEVPPPGGALTTVICGVPEEAMSEANRRAVKLVAEL